MIKKNEIRLTRQRKVILEELKKMKSHPTADELYEVVRNRLPRISLGTVYRNLEFLSQRGMIKKIEVMGKRMRFDGETKEHAHVRCAVCGRIIDLTDIRNLGALTREISRKTGFEVFSNEAEFLGICPDCRKKTSGTRVKSRNSGGGTGTSKSVRKRSGKDSSSASTFGTEAMKSSSLKKLSASLDRLYEEYNDRRFVEPDPLQFLYPFEEKADREVVGIIASSLAFGNIKQIIRSVSLAVDIVSRSHTTSPADFVVHEKRRDLEHLFGGFTHRWIKGKDMANLLLNTGRLMKEYGSLEGVFEESMKMNGSDIVGAVCDFVEKMNEGQSGGFGRLIPVSGNKSACKRINLFLRWMVRRDNVDPGGWEAVKPAALICPVDVHIFRIARALGFTRRKTADLKTAVEITEAFKRISPGDPVKYDFALTRFGIKGELSYGGLLRRLAR